MNIPLSYIENYFFEYDRNAKLNPSLKKKEIDIYALANCS